MQSTLVSARYKLQSGVNTNAPTKGDACARNLRYNLVCVYLFVIVALQFMVFKFEAKL